MTRSLYMTADEVAAALGVSVATVYAYVSRRILSSHRTQGSRATRYLRADVERIQEKGDEPHRVDSNALVTQTRITMLTDNGPYYRGQSAIALSETATLEAVAALLWEVDETEVFPDVPPRPLETVGGLKTLLEGLSAVDRASILFPLIENANPRAYDLSPAGFARTGADVMRWFAAIIVGLDRPSAEPIHKVVVSRSENPKLLEPLVRKLLVLAADHELDPTTYAVRAVANTGVTPYRAALAGLTASTGRRLTYGRSDTLTRFVEEVTATADAKEAIIRRLREGDALPGFGSSLYTAGDPRAAALHQALTEDLDGDQEMRRLNDAIEVAFEVTGQRPDFALLNLFLGRKLGLVRQDGVTLRLARMAGWIANAMEQYHGRDLVRTRASYTGVLPMEDAQEPSPGSASENGA